MSLKQLQKNKSQLYKAPKSDCLKVLGSNNDLNVAAGIWENYKDVLTLISTHCLVSFCETQAFSDENIAGALKSASFKEKRRFYF